MQIDCVAPALVIAEQHNPDEATDVIQQTFDERARELEADMHTARLHFEATLQARGGD